MKSKINLFRIVRIALGIPGTDNGEGSVVSLFPIARAFEKALNINIPGSGRVFKTDWPPPNDPKDASGFLVEIQSVPKSDALSEFEDSDDWEFFLEELGEGDRININEAIKLAILVRIYHPLLVVVDDNPIDLGGDKVFVEYTSKEEKKKETIQEVINLIAKALSNVKQELQGLGDDIIFRGINEGLVYGDIGVLGIGENPRDFLKNEKIWLGDNGIGGILILVVDKDLKDQLKNYFGKHDYIRTLKW